MALPQRPTGRPWHPMSIGCQDIFENAGSPSFFKNFSVSIQMQFERNLVLIRCYEQVCASTAASAFHRAARFTLSVSCASRYPALSLRIRETPAWAIAARRRVLAAWAFCLRSVSFCAPDTRDILRWSLRHIGRRCCYEDLSLAHRRYRRSLCTPCHSLREGL